MPTTRARHQITETDEIAASLNLAAKHWPDESRSDLMRHLIVRGARALAESPIERTLEIEAALRSLAGLSECYPEGYLDNLRGDWERTAQ